MPTICPRCNHPFDGRTDCPACGYHPADGDVLVRPPLTGDKPVPWQHTLAGQLVIGVLVAQGVSHVLLQLLSAVLAVVIVDGAVRAEWYASELALGVKQALQAVGLLTAGVVIGAGQRRWLLTGTIMGLCNSVVFILLHLDRSLEAWSLIAQPPFQSAIGALGCWIGSLIWQPIQPLGEMPKPAARITPAGPAFWRRDWLAGPIHWQNVLLGTAVAVGGTFSANYIFSFLTDSDGLKMSVENRWQAKFVIWEIAVLALLVGGGVAGTGSRNGFKQGLIASLLTAFLLLIINPKADAVPTQALGFDLIRMNRFGFPRWIENFVLTMLSVVPLTTLGGVFGSQLLPPITRRRRRLTSDD